MEEKFIFRDDDDLSRDYSDFETLERLCNHVAIAYNNDTLEPSQIFNELKEFDIGIPDTGADS